MKVTTWKTLKEFVDSMTPEQLEKNAYVLFEDSNTGIPIIEGLFLEEDVLRNPEDEEEIGTIPELKELMGENFNIDGFEIATPKGTPFLYASEDLREKKEVVFRCENCKVVLELDYLGDGRCAECLFDD